MSVLEEHKSDAVIILRLGAFANPLQTQMQLVLGVTDEIITAERDRLHTMLPSIGYLKEAIDMLQQVQPRVRSLLNIARKNGYAVARWSEIEPLLTHGPGTLYERAISAYVTM